MVFDDGSTKYLKVKAFELRRNNKSYREISKLLAVPKSTLSGWFKNKIFSEEIKIKLTSRAQKKAARQLRLMAKANKDKWAKIHLNYRQNARLQFSDLRDNPLFAAGLALYWGEGDKRVENGVVKISNVDPRLLKVFIAFLITICNVNLTKIRIWLLLYPDHIERECKEYWSKELKVPTEQFVKPQFINGKEKTKRLNYGVCCVEVYSRELKEKIIEWINTYFEDFDMRVWSSGRTRPCQG